MRLALGLIHGIPLGAVEAASELRSLRDRLELSTAEEQQEFAASFIPWALGQLQSSPVSLLASSPEHQARASILSLLRQLPALVPEATKAHVEPLMHAILQAMKTDAEDNATEAMHLFTEINKAFRSLTEQYVPAFLDYVLELAQNFKAIMKERLEPSLSDSSTATRRNGGRAEGEATELLNPADRSFRLLHESPVMIVLVFQLHRRYINEYIPRFVPVVVRLLSLDAERPEYRLPDIRSISQLASEPVCRPRGAFNDYISAQIKILSFLAYIARGFAPTLREYRELIPTIIVRLLRRCPPECAPSRKELLVAIRHILSTELRQSFVPCLETMMDERLLLGEGYTAHYIFRPAAYSMLADLIHHVRLELSPELLSRVITMYSRALHDPTLPNGIQTMSIKLLLNLIDAIVHERFSVELRRTYLLSILTALLHKFDWLQGIVGSLISRRAMGGEVAATAAATAGFDERRYDPFFDDPLHARPIPTDSVAIDPSRDNIRDLKFQLKTLINGVKNLIIALKSTAMLSAAHHGGGGHEEGGSGSDKTGGGGSPGCFTSEEGELFFAKLFRDGILCFGIFQFKAETEDSPPHGHDGSGGRAAMTSPSGGGGGATFHHPTTTTATTTAAATISSSHNPGGQVASLAEAHAKSSAISPSTLSPDEKDLLDQFGFIFTLLEPAIFHDVMASSIDFLIERTKENIALVSIPQYFLAISGISRMFSSILARTLMDRFEDLGASNGVTGAVVLRLFKLLFLAVSVYPEENESVLQPHLAEIILSCFRHYPKSASPVNYFLLLRSLFRSIGGGRFDSLYKEVLPLLQTILDELAHLSPGLADPSLRDMYVELCLTTPVRLSNLLPFLSYLMRPVLLALQSGTDLVNQGLRTFELCVDNLTPDFLEPIVAPVFPEILECLWKMLKPPPANQLHSHTAVRLLGKLGGKSRRYLTAPPSFAHRKSVGAGIALNFDFGGERSVSVPGDSIVRIAMATLNNANRELHCRRQALCFLKRVIGGIFATHNVSEYFPKLFQRLRPADCRPTPADTPAAGADGEEALKEWRQLEAASFEVNFSASGVTDEAARQLLCEIVCALFDAVVIAELREEVVALLVPFYRSIALLYLHQTLEGHSEGATVKCLDYDMLCDIILEYSTVQNEAQVGLAWAILRDNYEQYCKCIPDRETQYDLKVFFLATDKAISACFRTNTWQRVAACRTIAKICDLDLSIKFFWHHEIRLIRGVLYVMKSLPSSSSCKYSEELTSVIFKILRLSNRAEREDMGSGSSSFDEAALSQRKQYFDQVMFALVTELSNPNSVVRDAVKASFQLLSDIKGCEVTDLLSPLKTRVYGPIFSKPLRALPLHVQVGYIDAITYCLALRPPLLEHHDDLLRLIHEAVAVIESDDAALGSRTPHAQQSVHILNLRLVCIKLLSTCLSSSEFQQARLHPLRNQIVSVFFKMLYSRHTELVDVSRSALEQVMTGQHKLPTELLQAGLRPVLQSLGEPRHLNLAAVEGLRRILQIFSHFFKAEIGRKLLDHLYAWAGQQNTEASSGVTPVVNPATAAPAPGANPLSPKFSTAFPSKGILAEQSSGEIRIITAIMELFCLLPNCGQMFMGELFEVVMQLESVLRIRASSPFRPVLLRFIELYPADAVSLALDRISDGPFMALLASLLAHPSATKVIQEIGKMHDALLGAIIANPRSLDLQISYLRILQQYYLKLSSSSPYSEGSAQKIEGLWSILKESPQVPSHAAATAMSASPPRGGEEPARESVMPSACHSADDAMAAPSSPLGPLDYLKGHVAKLVYGLTVAFLRTYPTHLNVALTLLNAFIYPRIFDTSELPSMYRRWLQKCDPSYLQSILVKWTSLYGLPNVSFVYKERLARLIVEPLISQLHKADPSSVNAILDDKVFGLIDKTIWTRDCRACTGGSCVLAVEEIQITVLMLRLMQNRWPDRMKRYLGRLQDFLFNRVQSLDCSVRYSALYTLALTIIETGDAPSEILSVFGALLRSPSADIRAVLKHSFDLVIPHLAHKTSPAVRGEFSKLLSACLIRENSLMSLLLALWQSITHNKNELGGLSTIMVPLVFSFSRFGLMLFASPESRMIPLDLVETILTWHLGLVVGSAQSLETGPSDKLSGGGRSPLLSTPMAVDLLINSFIRLICSLVDYSGNNALVLERGLALLRSLLSTFQRTKYAPRLGPLERFFGSFDGSDDQQTLMSTVGIKILTVILAERSELADHTDIAVFSRWVQTLFKKNCAKIHNSVLGLVNTAFCVLAKARPGHPEDFASEEDLSSTSGGGTIGDLWPRLSGILVEELEGGGNLALCLIILTADKYNLLGPSEVILGAFARAFHKSVREHLSMQEATASNPNSHDAQLAQSFVSQIIIPGLAYAVSRVSHADMPRASILATLQQLWEHNTNVEVTRCLLEVLLEWMRSSSPVPSLREKVEILLIAPKYALLTDAKSLDLYLDVVYEIYSQSIYAKTELRSRFEGAFLRGLRSEDLAIRDKFARLLDEHVPRELGARLRHVFETQRWELFGSYYWIPHAMELILLSSLPRHDDRTPPPHHQGGAVSLVGDIRPLQARMVGDDAEMLEIAEQTIIPLFAALEAEALAPAAEQIRSLCYLAGLDTLQCHSFWTSLFPAIWRTLGPETQSFLSSRLIRLMSNDQFLCQARMRPNVIKSLVESLLSSRPLPSIPPHLMAYVMRTFASWHSGCTYLEKCFEIKSPADADHHAGGGGLGGTGASATGSDYSTLVSTLGAMYRVLGEDDFMYGALRRGFILNETNVALSHAQMGLWASAQKLLEGCMTRCRAGTLPFLDTEFSVWEERWMAAAQELQQWDLVTEISKSEMDPELGLECLWRLADWSNQETQSTASHLLKSMLEPSARSKFFESFMILTQNRENPSSDRFSHFQTSIEESLQLALLEWQALPLQPCPAHAQILHMFQMIVEIQESLALYSNLASGNIAHLSRPQFLSDLKGLLTAWRERLPNVWDGMNFWSDILAWRQHVFSSINAAFAPLMGVDQGGGGGGGATAAAGSAPAASASSTNSGAGTGHPFAFRGYHEMAWLINRFAHVARKNHLKDVCLSFLNRIYTLPNIEIQDAFLKLREQAKCYMETPADLPIALEVVNATNLNYFSGLQKGEFFALRSVILSRLGLIDDANRVFAQAVQIDLNTGHGWAAWGRFNDQRFSQTQDLNLAVNAVNCYLQAATLFKSQKARRFLSRILWLLTFEDPMGSLGKSFEIYNQDLPTWYWISFIPQLLLSLARREQRPARFVLMRIAKNYPQALYLPLRTFHEDCRIQYGTSTSGSRPPPPPAGGQSSSSAPGGKPRLPIAWEGTFQLYLTDIMGPPSRITL